MQYYKENWITFTNELRADPILGTENMKTTARDDMFQNWV